MWHRSLQRTSYSSSASVVMCIFSALYVYSKFGHHPHPWGYIQFRFFCRSHCWASPWQKITYSVNQRLSHSLTQRIWCPENRSFRFGTNTVPFEATTMSTALCMSQNSRLKCTLIGLGMSSTWHTCNMNFTYLFQQIRLLYVRMTSLTESFLEQYIGVYYKIYKFYKFCKY